MQRPEVGWPRLFYAHPPKLDEIGEDTSQNSRGQSERGNARLDGDHRADDSRDRHINRQVGRRPPEVSHIGVPVRDEVQQEMAQHCEEQDGAGVVGKRQGDGRPRRHVRSDKHFGMVA
jgi:hypothetical protein